MKRFLKRLFSSHAKTTTRRRRSQSSSTLDFVNLEPRRLLAAFNLNASNNTLFIAGTSQRDVAAATIANGDTLRILFAGAGIHDFAVADVKKIVFIGYGGDDQFTNNTSIDSEMYGHAGNDVLVGGSGKDLLSGGQGNDRLEGKDNADLIRGGTGNDIIRGGNGDDEIYGSFTGTNTIYGENGNDVIYGGKLVDTIFGGNGIDQIFALAGNDILYSGAGGVAGTTGIGQADFLLGLDGDDTIIGESGLDVFYGGNGNDTLIGGTGENRLHGQSGNDHLTGGNRNDYLSGGDQNDIIFGRGGNDLLLGGRGHDSLYGEAGNDTLLGESGNDGLFAGVGTAETLRGGSGADRFLNHIGDSIADMTSSDVVLRFSNAGSAWNDTEIAAIDRGLRELHLRTGGTRILKDTLDTNPLTFYKVAAGSLGTNVRGLNRLNWNAQFTTDGTIVSETYTRRIEISDWNESIERDNEWAGLTAIHEIGHSWDSATEINQVLSRQGKLWTNFLNASGWATSNPGSGHTQGLSQTQEPFDRTFVASAQTFQLNTRTWWRDNGASFARNHGKQNPKEDWSTVWESIFVPNLVANPTSSYAQPVTAKINIVQQLFDLL